MHNHAEQLAGRGPPKSGRAQMQTRQAEYARKLRGRFAAINAAQRRMLTEGGIFDGVTGGEQLASDWDASELTASDFDFDDPAGATERFITWLERMHEAGVLSVIERNDNVYIRRALSDGDRWALARLREAGATAARSLDAVSPAGFNITVRGDAAQYTHPSFNIPLPASTVRLLFNRNYRLLEGITADVEKEVQRVLSEGLVSGRGARDIARDISDRIGAVGKHRATLTARHEVMYAHNESSLARYDSQGVQEVTVLTSNPCEECEQYAANGPYPVSEVRGGLPRHPQCVCAWAPVI